MIEGLYEAHLPVKNLKRAAAFYEKLGLELACDAGDTLFYWIEKEKSWLGLWEGEEYRTPYHPSLKHVAFRAGYENMKRSRKWLEDAGATVVPFGGRTSADPFIRPWQGNGSVYFEDPDGNSLELMCFVDVPDHLKQVKEKLSFDEFERRTGNRHFNN
ncbi:VOC family protein [Alteribacter natronophilus]|uniref:VOC family protein n=1 Tax=Alteribacter natronophilus TaxID=2583810 RepID=UPI00110E0CEF|nr:VOC family protein [Alteribacter natronophilus]TMW71050.1 VOC family protein [Alteribacter natronophilus]